MTTLNEAILQATGGPSVNEGLLAYYKDGGASADNLADSERQWLCAQLGVAVSDPATNADLWMQYLADYPGSLNDKQLVFWLDGGSSLEAKIRAMFANGEEGALYYFTEDFAGLYQDAAGTTPVTAVGQPVGLMLDRRFGLERGPELNPSDNLAGWNLTDSDTSFSTTGIGGVYRAMLTVGKWYSLRCLGSATAPLTINTSPATNISQRTQIRAGFGECIFLADRESVYLRLGGAGTATVTSLSIRELPGNHASQATTTARPTLRSGPLRIDYDGVDDYLRTAFPDLGSDVTIARSIPGTGAQILTGQTIAAGDWDDNVTSCATLVIDRALTGPETALVTAFLDQQAGV